jgi:hypothetical protein
MNLLPQHAIGWDFDGTLVDHPAAGLMHEFIKATPDRTHYIITFRTHGLITALPDDLATYPSAPPLDAFREVKSVPADRWVAFERSRLMRRSGVLKGPMTEDEIFYVEWKGKVCRDLGLAVLVDDNTEHTRPGCEKYGIDLIHPDLFI